MAKIITQAEEIAAHLKAEVSDLVDIDVIVDKKKSLISKIKQIVAKVKGAAVIIQAVSGRNTTPDSITTMTFESVLSIAVITKPSKRKDEAANIDITESIMKNLHGYKTGLTTHCTQRVKVLSWNLVPSRSYLIHEIKSSLPTTLTTT